MDADFPSNINYWMTSTNKHDCFFNVGKEPGPVERIGAIKILLIGHSHVFRNILDEAALEENRDVTVKDSDPATFKSFLRCIYGATEIVMLKLTFENCLKVLYLCKEYHILDVGEKCSKCILELHQPLTTKNVLYVLLNHAYLNHTNLKRAVLKKVQSKTKEIFDDELFLELDQSVLLLITLQNNISCKEVILWEAFLNWASYKMSTDNTKKDLRSCFGNTLKYIRFSTMESQEFCTYVVPSNVLTPEEVVEICKSFGTKRPSELKDVSNSIVNRFNETRAHGEFILSYIFHNIGDLSGTLSSKEITFGDFKWYFELNKKEDGGLTNVGLFLHCSPASHKRDWKCNASVEMILVNHFGKQNFSLTYSHMFCQEESFGFSKYISWDKLMNLENGYVKNQCIEVRAEVEII